MPTLRLLPLVLVLATTSAGAQARSAARPATAAPAAPVARAAATTTPARAAGLPWNAGDKPPALAGFQLGERMPSVRTRLGAPLRVDTLGKGKDAALSLTNAKTGTTAVVSPIDGLAILYLTRREAGVLDEVRVGDAKSRVLTRWGQPTTVQGASAMWVVGTWVVVVELGDGDVVKKLALGRVAN
jgi:hypothetical protein